MNIRAYLIAFRDSIFFLMKTHGLIILIASIIYYFYWAVIKNKSEEEFNGMDSDSDYFDFLYFTVTVQSTVGFGDISPKSTIAKFLVMCQKMTVLYTLSDILNVVNKSFKKTEKALLNWERAGTYVKTANKVTNNLKKL